MRLRLYLRLWLFFRKRALIRHRTEWPGEYEDAHFVWSRCVDLHSPLRGPAWVTHPLPDDLALHDAADFYGMS